MTKYKLKCISVVYRLLYKVPSTMVRIYCTLFLIKIDLWSRGTLPIDRSPWSMDKGSLMECIFVYLQKKIVFNLVMEQNKEQRQIKLLEIRANFRKLH